MKRIKKIPPPCITAVVWLLTMLLTVAVIHNSIAVSIREKVNDTELVLASTASKIEYSINSRLLNLRTLEVLIGHDGGMLCDFEEHASVIYESDPCVRCIQLAPNGVITHIYPLEGNENAFGNLFVNALRKDEARHARDSGQMTMGGPYELHQGGVGMVARRPIYMKTDEGERFFWGLALEVMDLPILLETAEMSALSESGYSYRLWHYAPQTGEPTVFAGEEKLPDVPLTTKISVPGGVWYLSLVPTVGWFSAQLKTSALSIFLAFNLLTLFLAVSFSMLAGSKRRFAHASVTDPLTGLGNSRSFYDDLALLAKQSVPFFLYYMDLNKFKEVNDTYGHSVGNALLRAFSDKIRATTTTTTTTTTTLYRIGGDEFAIIKHGTDLSDARKYREELLAALKSPFSSNGLVLPISSSIGFASYPWEDADPEKVLRLAEARMYEEKARASQPVALNSRTSFFNALIYSMQEHLAQDPNQRFYFFHIDYKDFKLINYNYGIDAGDSLLTRAVSYVNSLPECILCSRGYADCIFFVIREASNISQAEIADRFQAYYDRFIREEQDNFPDICLSINCGCSEIEEMNVKFAAGCANVGRLISREHFDIRPEFVDAKRASAWMAKKSLESSVLLATRQMRIYYELQPILSASEEKMVFAEALGRLRGKNNEVIPPGDFVPILTKTGDIVRFDLYILECVCRDIRERLDAGKPVVPISVNLSPRHLEDAQTPEKIRSILERYRIPPKMIGLEITENLLIRDIQKLLQLCQQMHDMGVLILLDDFGAGYLNFETLGVLPIDALKIDRSLISAKACESGRSSSILSMIFSIATDMDIPVICEGVEMAEQRRWLRDLGADYLQGFYYARPSEPDRIYERFL